MKSVTIILTTDGNHDQFSLFRKPSEVLRHIEEIANQLIFLLNVNISSNYIASIIKI